MLYHYYLRELFYYRHPGDARVKVGSEREFASSPRFAKPRPDQNPGFSFTISPAGTLQNWRCCRDLYSEKDPYRQVGFCAHSGKLAYRHARCFELCLPSDARRSYAIFAKYWRCYTRKIATGAPQHRPGAVVFPGVMPGYKIDTFLKDVN